MNLKQRTLSWLLILFLFIPGFNQAQDPTLPLLFKNSFKTFELLRNDLGIYRDSKLFAGIDFHPSSVASIGMGLVSLCIADQMGWIDDAEAKVLTTLQAITGQNPGFNPDRNVSGYYRHWIDMQTGARAWNSEYSTIDTGILTCGALFAKTYFCSNAAINELTDQLWSSIDWSKAIANPSTGGIFRTIETNGEGTTGSITLPFNEYMIVAWLAFQQEGNAPGRATELWNNFYADPTKLPTSDFNGIPVLTDTPGRFLSSFVIQFPYYLCHYFTEDNGYHNFFNNARRADSLWWNMQGIAQSYEWGLGAGSSNNNIGYHPDAINDNPSRIYSPHIIAGFIPVYEPGGDDLLDLYQSGKSIYSLPNLGQDLILWRKSLNDVTWTANEVQGVDYATMLFGLATLPQFLGTEFFASYNDFFGTTPCEVTTRVTEEATRQDIQISPNPTSRQMQILFENGRFGIVKIQVLNIAGQEIATFRAEKRLRQFQFLLDLGDAPGGTYLIVVSGDHFFLAKKIVIRD